MSLSSLQKRAVFKVAVDLVKADNQIHGNEVDYLDRLQKEYSIPAEELDMIHYMTLQEAMAVLCGLDAEAKAGLYRLFRQIVSADNDIDFRESILLSAILLQMESGSSGFVKIVTTLDSNADYVNDQLVYLEEKECPLAREILADPYENLLMVNLLSKMGLQFFYLPEVVASLVRASGEDSSGTVDILQKSIEYMVPLSAGTDKGQLRASLGALDIPSFTRLVRSHFRMDEGQLQMSAYMMLNVREGYVLDDEGHKHRCLDFLCIDVSSDLKERILHLACLLSKPEYAISYRGYYKVLYDFLSSENKVNCNLLVDSSYDFVLDDLQHTPLCFRSAPQCKTLYLLLLYYSPSGISQAEWAAAEALLSDLASRNIPDEMDLRLRLMRIKTPAACLVANILTLYGAFAHRDCPVVKLLDYVRSIIVHRSSLKNYINAAVDSISSLADKELYSVVYRPDSKSYAVPLKVESVKIQTSDGPVPLRGSSLWEKLHK